MNRKRHGCLLAAFLVFTAIVAQATSVEADEIRIWPTAVVLGDAVTLADVADLRGFDLPAKQHLSGIIVHAAPRAGSEVLVRIDDVRGALAEADANLGSIRILGSARCKVSKPRAPRKAATARVAAKRKPRKRGERTPAAYPEPRQAEPPPKTLESVIRRHIAARVSDPGAKLEIRFSPASDHILRLSAEEYDFKIHPANDRKLGFLSFGVDAVRNGQREQIQPIVAEVQLVKEVVVARRPVNRGKIIEGRDLRLEGRRFTDFESIGITELAAAVGRQCGYFLRAGEMLRPECLRATPLVRRGERVTIWVRSGGVEINTTGKAQQPGALGQIIEVRRDGAKRKQDLIEAVVTGPGTVAVSDIRQLASR